jgi:hypothetical protein
LAWSHSSTRANTDGAASARSSSTSAGGDGAWPAPSAAPNHVIKRWVVRSAWRASSGPW